jgi:tetratricopeptide (TPR) repeat protein
VREPLLLQTLEIRKKFQGEVHPDYTFSLIDLGVLYSSMSDYARAEPYDLQALEIRKKVLGEAHPDYAGSLHRLGVLYSSMKDYNHAKPYYLQALEIRKKVLGEAHRDCATSLNNLGMLYLEMKDFAQAEPFLRQAMEIRKKVLGETHPDYATSLNNLGMLYWSMGDFQRAEPLFLKSMEIIRKAYGEEDFDYLTCLNNVGSLYSSMKNYAGAEPYLLQSMKILRKKLGEKDPEYARSLSNLGRLYLGMNEFARAEPYFLQAVEIWRDVLGHQHPDYPMGLYNLGTLYSWMGDDVRAEPLLRQALEIWQKTIGEDHINLALAHHSLGIVLLALNRTSDAESELQQSARIGLAHLQQTFAVQTERQRLILLEQVRVELDSWLAVAPAAAVEPAAMYDRLLLWKGIVFVEQQRQHLLRSDPSLVEVFTELESLTRQLAAISFAVPTSEGERQLREQQIATLTEDKERIERQLAQQSAAYRQQQRTIHATSQGHFSNLPRNAALIDFLVYTDSAPAIEGTTSRDVEKRLMAFVIRSNTSIQRFDLGPVAPLTELIDDWRKQARYPVGLLGEDHPGVALRKLIWEPLETSLVGAETVLISPDGPLCRFPFAALPGTQSDTFLIEERAVAVIPVPQLLPQLLASTATDETPVTSNESLLLVGAVEYGGSPGVIGEARGGETAVSLDELERSAALPTYGPLIETRAEIDQLQRSFEAQFPNQPIALLDGTQATEAAFRLQVSGYRWLHLATHGFFAPARLKSVPGTDGGGTIPAAGRVRTYDHFWFQSGPAVGHRTDRGEHRTGCGGRRRHPHCFGSGGP